MSQPLLALSTGELQRLAACVRSLQSPPAEAALNQHQIASERPQVRQELLDWLAQWQQRGGSNGSLDLAISLLLEQRHQQVPIEQNSCGPGPMVELTTSHAIRPC